MSDLPMPDEIELIYRSRKDGSEIRVRSTVVEFEYRLASGREQRPEVIEVLREHGLL